MFTKKKLVLFSILSIAATGFLVSCSSGSSGDAVPPPVETDAISSGLAVIDEKIRSSLAVDSTKQNPLLKSLVSPLAAGFQTSWEDSGVTLFSIIGTDSQHDTGNNGQVALPHFVAESLDPATVRANGSEATIFGRMNHAFSLLCLIGKITGGVPTVGTKTIDFTGATTLKYMVDCGMGTEPPVDSDDQPIYSGEYSVAAVTPNTYYDYKVTLTTFGETIYIKTNDSVLSIAAYEAYSREESPGIITDHLSRKMAILDKVTGNVRASYFSKKYEEGEDTTPANGYFSFHRMFVDGTTNQGHMISSTGQFGATNETDINYSKNMQLLSVSSDGVGAVGFVGLYAFSGNDSNALVPIAGVDNIGGCVNPSTGAVLADDTTSCAPVSGKYASAYQGMVWTAATVNKSAAIAKTGESNPFPFTGASDIHTAAEF